MALNNSAPSRLLIYLPALNEAERIAGVIQSIKQQDLPLGADILVVNDGSTDNTKALALEAGAQVVSHPTNRGVGSAFQSAQEYALEHNYDYLVSMDADGQFDPIEIPMLLAPLMENGHILTLGTRFHNGRPEHMSAIKYRGNHWVNSIIGGIGGMKLADASCGFRAYSREALLRLNLQGQFTYTHETILDLLNKGCSIAQVPITVQYFPERQSRVAGSITQYAIRASRIIFKCQKDYQPFRFFGSIALLVLLVSLLLGGFVGIHWARTGMISPYKSLGIIALGLLTIAFLLFTTALIADSLGRLRVNQEKILYETRKIRYARK